LDIFGFEDFRINSFEQLCINFCNEKLQQLYVTYIFKSDEKEFIEEGLKDKLANLNYKDNTEVIELIDKYPLGIISLLNESTSLGSGTD
jgi:myosin-7